MLRNEAAVAGGQVRKAGDEGGMKSKWQRNKCGWKEDPISLSSICHTVWIQQTISLQKLVSNMLPSAGKTGLLVGWRKPIKEPTFHKKGLLSVVLNALKGGVSVTMHTIYFLWGYSL